MFGSRQLRAFGRIGMAATLAVTATLCVTNWRLLSEVEASTSAHGQFDVAIVPGCHVDAYGPSPRLKARLEAAVAAYHAHQVKRILVSGNDGAGEAAAMKHWLLVKGVPERDILTDGSGTRTLVSMKNAVTEYGVRSAIICTQKLFMARSLFLARSAGLSASGVEARLDMTSLRAQTWEAIKRSVAFGEVAAGRLHPSPSYLALNVDLE
jgi:vancomycin permeability regulator SanA